MKVKTFVFSNIKQNKLNFSNIFSFVYSINNFVKVLFHPGSKNTFAILCKFLIAQITKLCSFLVLPICQFLEIPAAAEQYKNVNRGTSVQGNRFANILHGPSSQLNCLSESLSINLLIPSYFKINIKAVRVKTGLQKVQSTHCGRHSDRLNSFVDLFCKFLVVEELKTGETLQIKESTKIWG